MTDPETDQQVESTWDRLHRRKVVQWGIAYCAGAWGLLQGLEYVSNVFDWPRQLQKIATLGLLLGLPIAIVLAWYHGDRGEQQVTRTELAVLTVLFLLGGGLFWSYERSNVTADLSAPPVATVPIAATIPTDDSIAVLPFVNTSPDKDQEYFADGISEELLNLLAQVPQLRVIARTSSFSFKGKEVDIATIAKTLHVANVLEGSVRKSDNTLRITVQLVRASDSSQLWSQTYDRQLTDIFKLQDEIAAAVVDELKIKLLGAAPKTSATDPRAYVLFLQAREVGRQYTQVAYDRSLALYRQALTIDPAYVAAWVGLAEIYFAQMDGALLVPQQGIPLMREATEKALSLDPLYAPALAELGVISIYYDRDLAAAARNLERALQLSPANSGVIGVASILSRRLGRLDQAIELAEYRVASDPVNSDAHSELGTAYRYAGRLDDAIGEFRTMLLLSPGHIYAHEIIGEMLLQQGDARSALLEINQEFDEQWRLYGLAMAYHALGRRTESDAALAELNRKYEKTSAYSNAIVHAYRGEADLAFKWMEKAAEAREIWIGAAHQYPMLENLHSDPRWLPFLRKHGMAPEQFAAIKFDVNLPD